MGELKTNAEKTATTVVEVRKKPINPYVIVAVVTVIAVIVFGLLINTFNEKKKLEVELKEKTDEVERGDQLYKDLQAHANGLEIDNKSLADQLANILNIQEQEPVITSQQIEEQLSAVSELATQAYMYTNAEQSENNKKWIFGWDMPLSEKSFIVKYDGVIKAGIDLSAVDINVNENQRTITVTLPASKIIDHNVPQDKIEVFGIRDNLFNKMAPNDPNSLIATGKETMAAKAIDRGLLAEADKEAQTLIKAFLTLVPGMDSYKLIVQ